MFNIVLFFESVYNLINLFYLLIFLIILQSSILSILSKNPVYSVLFLILVYLSISLIFFLMEIEFLAIILLIIYVGAISVLFLFIIMMIDIKFSFDSFLFFDHFLFFIFLIVFFLLEIFLIIKISFFFDSFYYSLVERNSFFYNYLEWLFIFYYGKLLNMMGFVLYVFYFVYFLTSSLILLVSMVGSILLTLDVDFLRLNVIGSQNIFSQIYRFYNYFGNFYIYYNKKNRVKKY